MIWRGPMITKLLTQFLREVDWGTLDVLVLDLPPGTGDAQLTIAQQAPLSGGVIVTTPQDVALLDVQRGITMFNQVNAPVLGVIENMSYHVCSGCGDARRDLRPRRRRAHGGAERASRSSARFRWCAGCARAWTRASRSSSPIRRAPRARPSCRSRAA